MSVSIHDVRFDDQVFTHKDLETGEIIHFHVSQILRDLKSGKLRPPLVILAVDRATAELFTQSQGVEADHLPRIANKVHDPILLADFDDGTSLVIDGNHRYVLRFTMGFKEIKAYRLDPKMWEPYVITDIPPDLAEAMLPNA